VSHRIKVKKSCAPAGAPEPHTHTHLSLHYHIVFSTKERRPLIVAAWRERMHAYLGGIVRNPDGVAEAVSGVDDHVHLLIGLRATHCLADVVGSVKSVSSRWVHEEIGDRLFTCQEGYGGFTVSPPQCVCMCAVTSGGRRSIIGNKHIRTSISNSSGWVESSTMSDTCGERGSAAPSGADARMGRDPVAHATG
jgi:REP element-mobilizing transposase RayT